jgi:hypothetical protein
VEKIKIAVKAQRQYATPGRAAMFAWKPFYTVHLPVPRTDGRNVMSANSKAELKFHVSQYFHFTCGCVPKFELVYPTGIIGGNRF